MQSRFLAGPKGLTLAVAVAGIVLLSTGWAIGSTSLTPKVSETESMTLPSEPTVRTPVMFPRTNYVWPFSAGPFYGEVDASQWGAPGVLNTMVGSFDLTRGLPLFPTELRTTNKLDRLGAQYFVLLIDPAAFADGRFDVLRDAITSQGGALVQEMGDAGHIARLNRGALAAIAGTPGLLVIEPYHPAFKLDPAIGRVPLNDAAAAVSDTYKLEARLFPGEDATAVAQALKDLGANVLNISGDTVRFEIGRARLPQVAALEPIYSVHESLPMLLHGQESSGTVQSGNGSLFGARPYNDAGILGAGQILMVLDSGIQLDGGDLSDTRTTPGTAGPAHRKVLEYSTTNAFTGGSGDLFGCDAPGSGGFTHGHVVSATALGNATDVDTGTYGAGWIKNDTSGNQWDFDGIAPKAKLIAYDGQVSAAAGGCTDPNGGGIQSGDLYAAPSGGSLAVSYGNGARIVNFSWGTDLDTYTVNAQDIDQFIIDKKDAMVFISVGNSSVDTNTDGRPDAGTSGSPASAKNAVTVGASDAASGSAGNNRAGFSSVGPATATNQRVSPVLMAPGIDFFGTGFATEYSCGSGDNDQIGSPLCNTSQGLSGTSFASPAAAGAGLLVRDYFAQGFYPDGTKTNSGNSADQVSNVSGALVKAVLVASSQFMGTSIIGTTPGINVGLGGNLTQRPRFNNEQGYGRIQLNTALPLTTFTPTPIGMIICDGGITGGRCDTGSVNGSIGASQTQSYTLKVTDNTKELKIALAWTDGTTQGDALVNNLDMELCAPGNGSCAVLPSIVYYGNFFGEDKNFNRTLDTASETNCDYTASLPWPPASTGVLDNSAFSIPACAARTGGTGTAIGNTDIRNPVEAIFLSPDPASNGVVNDPGTAINEAEDNQLVAGDWTLRIINRNTLNSQSYALAIAGPVQLASSTRIARIRPDGLEASGSFVCNDQAKMIVQEFDDPTDTGMNNNATEVKSRSSLEVTDPGTDKLCNTADDIVKDTETNINFTDLDGAGAGLKYEANVPIVLTDATAFDPGNGALDVRNGYCIRSIYADKTSGSPDANKRRTSAALVDCRTLIASGGVVWGNFGRDAFTLVDGGCETDKRGWFSFGFPDKYMDAGEKVGYRIAFLSQETEDLDDATLSIRPVLVDGDSTKDCAPNSAPGTSCADPNRTNNLSAAAYLTVLDSPKIVGRVAAGSAISANFLVDVASSIPANTEIEMLLGVSARKSGKPTESYAVSRHKLDKDEVSFFYSTDFLTGGSENRDTNENEYIEDADVDNPYLAGTQGNATSAVLDTNFRGDYRDEALTFSNAQAQGRNTTLNAPWNFESDPTTGSNGWRNGLNNISNTGITGTVANWGEDKDFDNVLDGGEDRDPGNSSLDKGWSTLGGCGWQTKGALATGGAWHTGLVRATSIATCLANGANSARCQTYETVTGLTAQNVWWELLLTPKFDKVNQCPTGTEAGCFGRVDATGDPVYQVEFTNWAWNLEMDIKDVISGLTWEMNIDNDINPIDLLNDGSILGSLFGTQGARAGGNAPLTDGFTLFSNISACQATGYLDGGGSPIKTCGGLIGGTACTDDTPCTGSNITGILGANRVGSNNCFFEGKTSGVANALQPYGLARPRDNDGSEGFCGRTDTMNGVDRQKSCSSNSDCNTTPYNGVCTKVDTNVDDYVTANGPIRNFDISMVNGPDMRYSILEDFYGDSGKQFQGAIGFYTQEGSPSAPPNTTNAYGLAVDDVVVEWREFRLDPDTTNCGPGVAKCAVVNLGTTNFFEGNSFIQIGVLDETPYDPTNNVNDCNNDGDYADAGIDDQDCDNNGTLDVTIKMTSEAEPVGEIVVLNRVGVTAEYRGNLAVSSSYNSVGVLFLSRTGTDQPTVTARYSDRDVDGVLPVLGCQNDPDPAKRGIVFNSTNVFVDAARIALTGIIVDDDNVAGTAGDNDGFADTNETIDVVLTLTNKSGVAHDDVVVSIQADPLDNACYNASNVYVAACDYTTYPNSGCAAGQTCRSAIECISTPSIVLGSLGIEACSGSPGCRTQQTPAAFRFKVANVSRASVNDNVNASFLVSIRAAAFDVLTRRVEFDIPLDLNATGGGTPSTFTESFDAASGFGLFTSMELDAGKASVAASEGYRCQYNDPNGPNPNDPGRTSCYLGFTTASNNGYDWHIHKNDAANNNIARAYDGAQSLHWGVHPSTGAKRDTTRFSQLDAIRTIDPIYLAVGAGASPELTFKHQISLTDSRSTNTPASEAADRGIVAIQFTNAGGTAISDWVKILPYENEYDVQGTDNFLNCTFDPVDDGNTENDFFDPADSLRRTGPSSTCMPEFCFAWHGDTDYRNAPGILTNIGRSFDGPGLAGSVDRGTWIEPKFNLFNLKGQNFRLRFLATTIEVTGAVTVNDTNIGADNQTGDDGWYIDQVRVTNTLTSAVTLAIDPAANTVPPFPACPACTTITPSLVATPGVCYDLSNVAVGSCDYDTFPLTGCAPNLTCRGETDAPGQPVELTAARSTADVCLDGTLQYQFWNDANGNSVVGDAGDVLLRDWTDNAIFRDAPLQTTRYALAVRCSTATSCDTASNSAVAPVTVGCPSTGTLNTYFTGAISFSDKNTVTFSSQTYDAIRGDLFALRSSVGNFNGSVSACVANDQTGTSFTDATSPGTGAGFFYLGRPGGAGFCNALKSWSAQSPKEAAGRDAEIGADPDTCP